MSQVNQKYLKDENNEMFSPITSFNSVFNNDAKSLYDELYFKPGDIFKKTSKYNSIYIHAIITGSSKQISYTLYTPKLLTFVNSISVSSLRINIRVPSGGYYSYFADSYTSSGLEMVGHSKVESVQAGSPDKDLLNVIRININLTSSGAVDGIKNNSILGVEINQFEIHFN